MMPRIGGYTDRIGAPATTDPRSIYVPGFGYCHIVEEFILDQKEPPNTFEVFVNLCRGSCFPLVNNTHCADNVCPYCWNQVGYWWDYDTNEYLRETHGWWYPK